MGVGGWLSSKHQLLVVGKLVPYLVVSANPILHPLKATHTNSITDLPIVGEVNLLEALEVHDVFE